LAIPCTKQFLPSNYPCNIDDTTNMPYTVDNRTPVDEEVVNRQLNAIFAVETELGENPSGTFGTVRARLDSLEQGGVGGGAIQNVLENGASKVSPASSLNFIGLTVTDAGSGQARVNATGLLPRDGSRAMTGNLNIGNNRIINLGDPVGAQDGATKAYVDLQISTADSWSEVLANGNTTDGYNPEISAGDQLQAEDGNDLVLATTSDGYTVITRDGSEVARFDGGSNRLLFPENDDATIQVANRTVTGLGRTINLIAGDGLGTDGYGAGLDAGNIRLYGGDGGDTGGPGQGGDGGSIQLIGGSGGTGTVGSEDGNVEFWASTNRVAYVDGDLLDFLFDKDLGSATIGVEQQATGNGYTLLINGQNVSQNAATAGAIQIFSGQATGTTGLGGSVTVRPGQSKSASKAPSITIQGGTNSAGGGGDGGDAVIVGGVSGAGVDGSVIIKSGLTEVALFDGDGLDMNGNVISEVSDPLSPQDAATKSYVDGYISANNEWSEVLSNGNTSGANNPEISSGQRLQGEDGSDLTLYTSSSGDIVLDAGGDGSDGYVIVKSAGNEIARFDAGSSSRLLFPESSAAVVRLESITTPGLVTPVGLFLYGQDANSSGPPTIGGLVQVKAGGGDAGGPGGPLQLAGGDGEGAGADGPIILLSGTTEVGRFDDQASPRLLFPNNFRLEATIQAGGNEASLLNLNPADIFEIGDDNWVDGIIFRVDSDDDYRWYVGGNEVMVLDDTTLSWTNTVVDPTITQGNTTNDTANTLAIQAQNTSGDTGGDLELHSGTGSVRDGYVIILSGTTEVARFDDLGASPRMLFPFVDGQDAHIKLDDRTSDGTSADLYIEGQDAQGSEEAGGNVIVRPGLGDSGTDDGTFRVNSPGESPDPNVTIGADSNSSFVSIGGTKIATSNAALIRPYRIQFVDAGDVDISMTNVSVAGVKGDDLTIHAQSNTNAAANSDGGDLYLESGVGGGGIDGYVIIQRGATEVARFDGGGSERLLLQNEVVEFGSAAASVAIRQESTSGAAATMSITSQASTTAAGGPLTITSGNSTAGGGNSAGVITIQSGTSTGNGPDIDITSGAGGTGTDFNGGDVNINAGDGGTAGASGAGGAVSIIAGEGFGSGSPTFGRGGRVDISAGHSDDTNGGALTIVGGSTTDGTGGAADIRGGDSYNGTAGAATIIGGESYYSIGGAVNVTGGPAYYGTPGGDVSITGGTGESSGSISITTPNTTEASGAPGTISLTAGSTSGSSAEDGAAVSIDSGSATGGGDGGALTISSGNGAIGGAIVIESGSGSSGAGGNISIRSQASATAGGDIALLAAGGGSTGGSVSLTAGNATTAGNVTITAGTGTTDGSITMNAGGGNVLILDGVTIDAQTQRITDVVDPINAQDAATKNYVDTGGADGYVINLNETVTTPNDTPDALVTYSPDNDSVIFIDGIIIARGAGGDSAGWKVSGVFEDSSGTVTQIGSASILVEEREDATWSVDMSTDGTDITVDVTGDAGENVVWRFIGKAVEGP
jgi:hypothetical protein